MLPTGGMATQWVSEIEASTHSMEQEIAAIHAGSKSNPIAIPETEPRALASETPASSFEPGRDELILQHLPTVRFVAKKVSERMPQHVDLDDLISAGLVGLIDAAAKFDWSKQVQFKSYAQFRIRGAILDSLRVMDWSPRELRRKGRAMAEAIYALSARLGHTPADAEIAQEMGLSLATFQQMTGELTGLEIGSLHRARTDEVGDQELDIIAAPPREDPLARLLEGQRQYQLAVAIEALPERERQVVTLYYFEELTMREIGLTLKLVESRVSQICTSAVLRLRKRMRPPGRSS